MENLGRSRETTRKIVAPAAARLAGAASRPNAPGGGPLGNRVRERVVSGFQDARRRLVERDRRSRRRPVICGRRRVSPKRAANRLSADGWKTQSRRLGSAFSAFPSDRIPIRHFCSRARQKKYTANERRERFPEISGLRPGRPAGVGVVKSMSQVPFRTGASIEGLLPSRAIAQGPSLRSSRSRERPSSDPRSVRRRRDAPGVQRARLVLKTVS